MNTLSAITVPANALEGKLVSARAIQLLPALREELKLLPASAQPDGSPAWVIQDPVRNRFFRIGWLEFELLVNWTNCEIATLIETVNTQTTLRVTEEEVKQFIAFLESNELLRLDHPSQVDYVHKLWMARKPSWWNWLLHNYLFFRVPLLRPQHWLARTLPYVAWLQTAMTAWVLAGLTLLGLYLVSRQWDSFTHTFVDQLTWSGLLGYAFALAFAKAGHELGHAYAATRHGVRVAHMGVAFLVMFPMLYTDTAESWRLKDHRHRLAIASAGMIVELALAGLSTLAWALTPDGALRNGLFFLATTSWILTLAVNLSPFMRFDGYFILSDLLDMPNLHERAGALARTWVRRTWLGFDEAWPEQLSSVRTHGLIAFALVTWLVRLSIFFGIAVMVYFYFFKVLGIFLMMVELVWFIVNPIKRELGVWLQRRAEIHPSRIWGALVLLLAGGLLLFLPLQTRIEGNGWLRASEQQLLFSPFAAQIVTMPPQESFRKGEPIMVLDSKDLGIDQEKALALAAARERQMVGLMGLPDGESQRASLVSQKEMHEAQARASDQQRARLVLKAPFDGVLYDVSTDLVPGAWVMPKQALGMLVNPAHWMVEAFVPEEDLSRIAVGQSVRIRQRTDPPQWLNGRVASLDISRTTTLPSPMLDASHGGPIATTPTAGGNGYSSAKQTRDALYRVHITLDTPPHHAHLSLVRVQIQGQPEALIDRFLRSVTAIAVRESGF